MKYGLNTLLFTGNFTDENTDLFKGIKEVGFDAVEIALAQKGDFDYAKTLEQLKANKLECSGICGMFGLDRDIRGPNKEHIRNGISYIKDGIDAAKALESDMLVGPIYSAVGRANLESPQDKEKQWQTDVLSLKEVCQYAEENGVYLCLLTFSP